MAHFEHNSDKFGYINLEDMQGIQTALSKLSFDPGTIDGKDGPKTQDAVRKFQARVSLGIDGIVGPNTRQALVDYLESQVAGEDTPSAS